ncbi:MAG: hypothetical protein V7603_4540 [Micromonosporaceae bacterium]
MSPSTTYTRTRTALLGATLALAVTLPAVAACGSGSSTGSGPTTPTTPAQASPTPAAPVKVTVDETEFKITLSQSSFRPGSYEFAVTNSGKFPHNVVINGPGVDKQKIPAGTPLTAGQAGAGTVTLQSGSYEIYCGVPGHKAKGMDLTIQVS